MNGFYSVNLKKVIINKTQQKMCSQVAITHIFQNLPEMFLSRILSHPDLNQMFGVIVLYISQMFLDTEDAHIL